MLAMAIAIPGRMDARGKLVASKMEEEEMIG